MKISTEFLRKKIFIVVTVEYNAFSDCTEIVKILAPLTDNPNAPDDFGYTPSQWAASWGHTEIVKILTPLRQS